MQKKLNYLTIIMFINSRLSLNIIKAIKLITLNVINDIIFYF